MYLSSHSSRVAIRLRTQRWSEDLCPHLQAVLTAWGSKRQDKPGTWSAGRPHPLAHLECLHFAERESPREAQAEVDPVSIFSQVTQCQPHREAGGGGQTQDSGSGGRIRAKLWGPTKEAGSEVGTFRTEGSGRPEKRNTQK